MPSAIRLELVFQVCFSCGSERSWKAGIRQYIHHPVMLASLFVITLVPFGLLRVRILGFSPKTQTFTALKTIAANLC